VKTHATRSREEHEATHEKPDRALKLFIRPGRMVPRTICLGVTGLVGIALAAAFA
jgi:hypothetical protein